MARQSGIQDTSPPGQSVIPASARICDSIGASGHIPVNTWQIRMVPGIDVRYAYAYAYDDIDSAVSRIQCNHSDCSLEGRGEDVLPAGL